MDTHIYEYWNSHTVDPNYYTYELANGDYNINWNPNADEWRIPLPYPNNDSGQETNADDTENRGARGMGVGDELANVSPGE